MAQQTINVGTAPNDGTGTPLRTAFQYTNSNFSELYTAVGPSGNNIVVPGNATITGDLTVDTSTLKVDSVNNRVGIGTATPSSALHLRNASATGIFTQYQDTGGINYVGIDNGVFRLANTTAQDLLTIAQSGVFSFLDGAGGTRMTLNATGLGVGDTPASNTRLTVAAASRLADTTGQAYIRSTDAQAQDIGAQLTLGGLFNASAHYAFGGIAGRKENSTSGNVAGYLDFLTTTSGGSLTSRMRIDSTGNVGIGVTPSAWRSTNKALQVGNYSSLTSSSAGDLQLFNNAYINSGGANIYQSNGFATRYEQYQGVHAWYTAPSGTAGNTATFTQSMTLDASGNLGIGVTPSAWISAVKGLQVGAYGAIGGASSNFNMYGNLYSSAGGTAYLGNGYGTLFQMSGGQYVFYQAGNNTSGAGALVSPSLNQSMTLDTSGNLLLGTPTLISNAKYSSLFNGNATYGIELKTTAPSGTSYFVNFFNSSTVQMGVITGTGTTVSYVTSSDYRLKEDVKPLTGALNRVASLKPSVYKWKADGSSGEGFLAHELAEVVPLAVNGEKDAVNEDGSVKPQGVDYSKVVPVLVAAIQELTARVQTLETR